MFEGWDSPKSGNWYWVSTAWLDLLISLRSIPEIKILMYVVEHTWGRQQEKVHITGDKFTKGTGLSKPSIIKGIRQAIEHGLLQVTEDIQDKGRIKRYFSISLDWRELTKKIKKERKPTQIQPRTPLKNSQRRKIMERDRYRCCHCNSWINLQIDHIIPVSKGGTNKKSNLQTLCKKCNRKKGVKCE